jgi:adenosine kinase
VRILRKGEHPIEVKALDGVTAVDPTGVGDAFRAGFLAAVGVGLGLERAAQVGCTIAASVVETTGTQEYVLGRERFLQRFAGSYGEQAVSEVAPHFRFFAP